MKALIKDETLFQYATDRQREYLEAYWKHGTYDKAAEVMGVTRRAVWQSVKALEAKAAQHGYAPEYDVTNPSPPGFRIKGTSTLYDESGAKKIQWVKTEVDKAAQEALFREAIDALCAEIKPVKKTKAPKSVAENLMSLYPVGDHHIGMLSWHEETDGDYDTNEAERLLMGAMDYLVDAAPPSAVGCIVLMGDFLHYDSFESVTPAHKNMLDSDTRYPRMVRAAFKTIRFAVDRALEKHSSVIILVSSGNHDPASMAFLRESLSVLYEKEPRVSVDRSPKAFHYLAHGKALIGVHHGDKVKMKDLPLLMAADKPREWGLSEHRYIFTGHVHHDSVTEHGNVRVESLRVLPPTDAYAYNAGYRSGRDMKRIDIHSEYGEVARQLVTPEMLA